MNLKQLFTILVLGIFSPNYSVAQYDSTSVDFQTWIDFHTIHEFNSKWAYTGDYGLRGIVSGEPWTTFYVRPTFKYRIKPIFDVRAGVALFITYDDVLENEFELRFHQEANVKWPEVVGMIFKHKLRFEERFFFYKVLDNDFSARLRYHFTIESPDFRLFSIKGPFYGLASVEFFLPLGQQAIERYVNQNRIEVGFGQRISRKFRYEIYYIWQNSKDTEDGSFNTSVNIFRLRLYLFSYKADKTLKDE